MVRANYSEGGMRMLYPTGILKNASTGRFHPISFRWAPTPSTNEKDETQRCKSIGHHTVGFDTLESAKEWIALKEELCFVDMTWEWDGTNTPAMIYWFPISLATTPIAKS